MSTGSPSKRSGSDSGSASCSGIVIGPPGIDTLKQTSWTKPEFTLPVPGLEFLFHLECDMQEFKHIGPGPYGDRSTVIFKGGRFEGPKMRGTIMAGGGDWEIVRNHDTQQTAHLNTRYNLLTHDNAVLYLQTTGTRTGPRSVLEALGNDVSKGESPPPGPDKYRMRLNLTFETGDERYAWINSAVFIASSGRVGSQVIYDAYQVL